MPKFYTYTVLWLLSESLLHIFFMQLAYERFGLGYWITKQFSGLIF